MKRCNKCGELKSLDQFHVKTQNTDGYSHTCKECKSKIDKAYREANKDVLKQKTKEKYHNNKEVWKARNKKRYDNATPEEVQRRKEVHRKYNQNMPEDVKKRKQEYNKKYFASEAGKSVTIRSIHKRRAQKIASEDGTVTAQALEELKTTQEYKCNYCKVDLDFTAKGKVHLDHVIPLSKGGAHSITNVVWSCAKCNLLKSNKDL